MKNYTLTPCSVLFPKILTDVKFSNSYLCQIVLKAFKCTTSSVEALNISRWKQNTEIYTYKFTQKFIF